MNYCFFFFFFFQAEDGIRDYKVTGVQTCALPICLRLLRARGSWGMGCRFVFNARMRWRFIVRLRLGGFRLGSHLSGIICGLLGCRIRMGMGLILRVLRMWLRRLSFRSGRGDAARYSCKRLPGFEVVFRHYVFYDSTVSFVPGFLPAPALVGAWGILFNVGRRGFG